MIHISKSNLFYNKFFFISIFLITIIIFNLSIFKSIYSSQEIEFTFLESNHILDGKIFSSIKSFFIFSIAFSWSYFLNLIFDIFSPKFLKTIEKEICEKVDTKNSLFVGNDLQSDKQIYIPERGLYQNILVTGTIGTGKTSSAMYPFTKQLIEKNIGMLVLDVKGNFHKKIKEIAQPLGRNITVIELNGKHTYNPLDKPNLKPSILANRLKTILTLFSQNTGDSYWLDKVEIYLSECIKLCRLYNDGYVTFIELHKLINDQNYLEKQITKVKSLFLSNKLSTSQVYDFKTCLEFFTSEFKTLDQRVLSIIQSEISRITQLFISDYEVSKTFCPEKSDITFHGFENIENNIIVLNMNIAEYRNLAKIIAAYLKLDFQSEVLMRLARKNIITPVAFVCDEYHEYVTANDADFFSESREAKCINIISTQSYTSLLNALKDQSSAKVIIQSLVNKIWFRTDDVYTIEEAQKQLGKEDKTKLSRTISESARETNFNYVLNTFKSDKSSLSESISTHIQHDFVYDMNAFSRELQTFQAICFISTGTEILPPQKIALVPSYKSKKFI